jgi:hypothetical protein
MLENGKSRFFDSVRRKKAAPDSAQNDKPLYRCLRITTLAMPGLPNAEKTGFKQDFPQKSCPFPQNFSGRRSFGNRTNARIRYKG